MDYWPAAAFGAFLGVLATAHLARTDSEIAIGALASAALAACVVLISPVFLAPFGFAVVILGWKRENRALGKRRRKTFLVQSEGAQAFWSSVSQGLEEARAQNAGPADPAQEDAHALIARARRANPFRPEGASGLVPHMSPSSPDSALAPPPQPPEAP